MSILLTSAQRLTQCLTHRRGTINTQLLSECLVNPPKGPVPSLGKDIPGFGDGSSLTPPPFSAPHCPAALPPAGPCCLNFCGGDLTTCPAGTGVI